MQSFGLGAETSFVRPLSPSRAPSAESDLLSRCRRGDDDAWAELVLAHQDRVISLLYRMTGDYQQALDLAQETFVQVFRKLSTFRSDSTVATWITSVALNTGRTIWRKAYLPITAFDDEPFVPWGTTRWSEQRTRKFRRVCKPLLLSYLSTCEYVLYSASSRACPIRRYQ